MTTYVLILYLVTGSGLHSATGGSVGIDGFTTKEKCEMAHTRASIELPRYEWGYCLEVNK